MLHLADDQSVIADDMSSFRRNVGLRRVRRLSLQRVPDEEPVEGLLSTIKPLDNVIVAKLLDDDRRHLVFSKTLGSVSKRFSRGIGRGGASNAA